ncbi:N-acetylmuramoyl-L-alanine amidase [Agrobacterium rosae]|uniref:N-acetylmuramoyl-L-alanine amidase n=1 Tax=Agrobacterium rosae TaxID=1972867 RepID=A0A1R3TJF4_9HYPH|nr:N-acetylmuramoyl-L-alanine amidase [Agrobacterium rosae]SCX19260.1 1,6-anhydro-N-acetylmuramyl-L-alanine amidase AmpD [Agrobacterium rosae]
MTVIIKDKRVHFNGTAVPFMESPFNSGLFKKQPKIVIIHYTFGASAKSSAEWWQDKKRNTGGSSAHVVIDRDGSIIQCVPLDTIAWHAGDSKWQKDQTNLIGLNHYSFGIELSNWGWLTPTNIGWKSLVGSPVPEAVIANHRNGNPNNMAGPLGWEPFPESQLNRAVELVRQLVHVFGVDEIIGHDDVSPGRKHDPGPAFDMHGFRQLVFGEGAGTNDGAFEVIAENGLNLRVGPAIDAKIIRLLPIGTRLEAIETVSNWMCVSVLDENGVPDQSGWVNRKYIR